MIKVRARVRSGTRERAGTRSSWRQGLAGDKVKGLDSASLRDPKTCPAFQGNHHIG